MTSLSINYRILIGSTIVYIILRIQISLQPYKDEHYNRIEILGTLAGLGTLSCGLLFVHNDDTVENFNLLIVILMLFLNLSFIINWTFLFLLSWNIRNQTFNKFMGIYGMLICQKSNVMLSYILTLRNKGELNSFLCSLFNCLKVI